MGGTDWRLGRIKVKEIKEQTVNGSIKVHGLFNFESSATQTTVGSAGSADALPSNPTGYLKIKVNGTTYVVPYYDSE